MTQQHCCSQRPPLSQHSLFLCSSSRVSVAQLQPRPGVCMKTSTDGALVWPLWMQGSSSIVQQMLVTSRVGPWLKQQCWKPSPDVSCGSSSAGAAQSQSWQWCTWHNIHWLCQGSGALRQREEAGDEMFQGCFKFLLDEQWMLTPPTVLPHRHTPAPPCSGSGSIQNSNAVNKLDRVYTTVVMSLTAPFLHFSSMGVEDFLIFLWNTLWADVTINRKLMCV